MEEEIKKLEAMEIDKLVQIPQEHPLLTGNKCKFIPRLFSNAKIDPFQIIVASIIV